MSERHVLCPACGTRLIVPPNVSDCVVRCTRCKARFRLPARQEINEEAVASWIKNPDKDAPEDEAPRQETPAEVGHSIEPPHSGSTAVLNAITDSIHLAGIDQKGALFEFPSGRLNEIAFRCSMPRKCMQCGTRMHLRPHVIIFTSQLKDSALLEAEHLVGPVLLSEEEVRSLSGEEFLNRLPKVPAVQPPADLPMPYWVCDMCKPAGAVFAQMQVDALKKTGWCRLTIRSLHRAMEFFGAAAGQSSKDYQEMAGRLEATSEKPWDTLSQTVQHRLEQWYRPGQAEQFTGYVPDRDHARTEDGMGGIVITNLRLICHAAMRHREARAGEAVELRLAIDGAKGILQIKAPAWEIKRMTVDRDGIERLRRGLTAAKFKVTWR